MLTGPPAAQTESFEARVQLGLGSAAGAGDSHPPSPGSSLSSQHVGDPGPGCCGPSFNQ